MNYLPNTEVVARRMAVALFVMLVSVGCMQPLGAPYGSTPPGSPATLGNSPNPVGGPSTTGAASNPFNSLSSLFGPSAVSGRPISGTSSTASSAANPLSSLSRSLEFQLPPREPFRRSSLGCFLTPRSIRTRPWMINILGSHSRS
jgi:hypothetical protein